MVSDQIDSNKSQNDLLRQSGERGLYNKFDWLKEADGKITSATILRDAAKLKSEEFRECRAESKAGRHKYNSLIVSQYLLSIEAANKSSVLLLGYAIELALKAGVVSLLIHAPKNLVEITMRKKYGHKLSSMLTDLDIKISEKKMDLLGKLESFIVQETRYPISSTSISDYCTKVNLVNSIISSHEQFELGIELYNQIREVIRKIDGSEDNVKIQSRINIDDDGYITYREGGGLPPVILFKYSSSQIKSNRNSLESLREVIENKNKYDNEIFTHLIELRWDSAMFFEVSDKKGLTKVR